jgi:hypothetical protein
MVVAGTRQGTSHEAASNLSRNQTSVTLFWLPAVADDDVALALAAYNVSGEEREAQASVGIGQDTALAGWGEVRVKAVQHAHMEDGALRIVINGGYTPSDKLQENDSLVLSLTASGEQTPAVPIHADADGNWQAVFALSKAVEGLPLFAELRALPGGAPTVINLGDVPRLQEQLELVVSRAYWDVENNEAVLQVNVHNPGEGAVMLDTEDIRIQHEGGDAYDPSGQAVSGLPGQIVPNLPTLIGPGETLGMYVAFSLPEQQPAAGPPAWPGTLKLQIGADLWEVSGLPTGRQP